MKKNKMTNECRFNLLYETEDGITMKQYKTPVNRKLSMYGFDVIEHSHNMYAVLEFDITNLRNQLRMKRKEGVGGSLFSFF